ncbi:2-amino-4-hydroxy-6-hydroxymethyldihydropteridine diphosphokinase [Aliibacillus thermotolerans]|uniref:2-amino-4-hydroxy-6-hydroxymethyldihydropteridine diphosphokinase n=1 Tax=Aliibacillus thermotolerans TaxID=1834418 RepID=A0ABW0U8B4_9BACI|nr:2-amino-4-hydroxy-6-hydroxymethyldihydropteridine diphosphokinase [Aliibacillus thermotolerans]MDA3128832.1 2-amino-4-hydroxy-6-hydroxymethyldihydropteridine diphosphokinase [Aliibacillus thermotolerans]
MTHRVYIGLGSNIGDRYFYLTTALKQLESHENIQVTKFSSIYETDPVGFTNQGKFLNLVAEIHTTLSPHALLHVTQRIESALKRVRTVRWGPRTIDLDILLFNDENIRMNDLLIPHPRMHERAFVLIPLVEIAADAYVPTQSCSVRTLANALPKREKETVVLWKHQMGVEIDRIKSM